MSNIFAHTREAVRVKVKKCEANAPPEWRKFSVDPQITSLEVLYSLLAKAFDIKSDFSIKYKAYDPAGNEMYLAVLSDWDLDAAFLRIHNISIQTATEPCLMLQMDIKPFTEVKEWDTEAPGAAVGGACGASSVSCPPTSAARELMSPLQQSFGASQKYVQNMQTRLPGLIMNQMEKTFSMVQKAFNLSEETMGALPPRPPLADNEFRLFLDALGQVQRGDELRKVIFFGGIDPSLRRVVWKHLLNVYPYGLNGHQRMDYMRQKSEHYYRLRDTWKTAVKQGCVVGELAYVTSMVKKDVLRTDRLHPFYAGNDDNQNIASLFNILTTYALNHPSVSYCQGMSDIASPLLVTMNDEAQAYICFCAIMRRLRGNFLLDGIAMTQKFAHLTEALSFYDAEFWDYLKSQQADDLLFCYRWLLLEMKREFPFEDALRMLEVQWSSLKYESCLGRELRLYEKEFVPTTEPAAAPHSGAYGVAPISPSYLVGKSRENPYTKVCALRRQSSSASLSALSGSLGARSSTCGSSCGSSNLLAAKLDATRRLNQSLDDNITHHAARRQRQRRAPAKAHQSLDESKMLQLMEDVERMYDHRSNEAHDCCVAAEDVDDDVFAHNTSGDSRFTFHPTNPFKEDALLAKAPTDRPLPSALPSSTKSSLAEAEDDEEGGVCPAGPPKSVQMPKGIAKLQNKNILSNYNAVSSIIAKQWANAGHVGESVRRASSSGGSHFRDLKEKIAASSKKALDDGSGCTERSQQRLVKNFNEFLNFASMNKSRVATADKNNTTIISNEKAGESDEKSASPAPPHPLVQLTRSGFSSSLDSDSSSVADNTNTWSGSTAATAIQQTHNLSSNSLHLDLNSLSSRTHSPVRTPTSASERRADKSTTPSPPTVPQEDCGATPDDGQDQEYYPMTTAMTRELRLEAENLDRQVFGEPLVEADDDDDDDDDIECKRLGNDPLDLVDLKEDEIVPCPDISELLKRRRQRDLKAKSSIEPLQSVGGVADMESWTNDAVLAQTDGDVGTSPKRGASLKSNPFLEEGLILLDAQSSGASSQVNNTDNLAETLELATDIPTTAATVELAAKAVEEEVALSKSAQSNGTSGDYSSSAVLPPPAEFGGGNPFLIFLCLTLLLQHRNTIMKSGMDYNEIAMHFDKMVRKHDVTRVLNQARRMYIEYLKTQTSHKQQHKQQPSCSSLALNEVNKNSTTIRPQQDQ